MVIPALRERIVGRYGGVGVTTTFFNQVTRAFIEGARVTETRVGLRATGFRFPNQTVTDIFREFRTIASRERGLNSVRNDAYPGPKTLTPVNRSFGRRYQYAARITFRNRETGATKILPRQFTSDEPLTAGQIRERFEAIAERNLEIEQQSESIFGADYFTIHLTAALEGL